MEIKKCSNHLCVYSNVYFDERDFFCGRPYIYLTAHKTGEWGWCANTIGIALRDEDDYDFGLVYKPGEKNFTKVLHELINWMRDHEQGTIEFDKWVKNADEFFPDCGCERVRW